ncbi:MAG: hypothetical protein KIT87_20550 [Anaerolineae bacterium]|nr:hypothetical protein [Anaerolineae bacterium]
MRLHPPEGSEIFGRVAGRILSLAGSTLLVLLAFAVRVGGLADHSLWLDEAQLLVRARSDLPTALMGRTPLDLAPPFYPLLLHLWIRLGEPDCLVRFPSVVASVLAVAVLARLRPWPVGPIAALIYTVAPTQILYAQEATPYALVGLLASAALVAIQALDVFRKHSLGPAAWLVVLAVLSAYTYYGLAFLWLGLDLCLLARLARDRLSSSGTLYAVRATPSASCITLHPLPSIRHVLLAHLAVALACLPLLPLWQRQAQAGLDAWWGQYGSLEGWASVSLFVQGGLTHGLIFALLPFSQPPTWLVLTLFALVLLGARRIGWMVGGMLIPLGLAYAAASLGRYPFEGRYLLFSAPALYALLAAGLTRLFDGHPECSEGFAPKVLPEQMPRFARHDNGQGSGPIGWRCRAGAFTVTTAALVASLVTAWPGLGLPVPWAVRPPREELRPLLTLLEQRRLPGDAIYVTYGASPAVAHYQRLGVASADLPLESGWPAGRTRFQASQALAAAQGHRRLWLVVAHALPGEEAALAEALTRRGAWLRERVTAPGAALLLWDLGE